MPLVQGKALDRTSQFFCLSHAIDMMVNLSLQNRASLKLHFDERQKWINCERKKRHRANKRREVFVSSTIYAFHMLGANIASLSTHF
jgi:hypothetical protein